MGDIVKKNKETFLVKIISNREISEGVFAMETEKTGDFIPGQIVALALHPGNKLRLYSLASGNEQSFFRILYQVNSSGELSPVMSKLKQGDSLYISTPFGRFTDQGEEAWWIATGTGIAPFISMMESGLSTNKILLQGARYINQFYFSDEFNKAMGNRYLRFCTRETGNGVINGRVTNYLKDSNQVTAKLKYYICGSAEMVVEVRDILISKGVPFNHVIAEIYF